MTIKEYRENTSMAEQKEFAKKLQVWLTEYTDEVYKRVMPRLEEIINNEMAMYLLDELYKRHIKETESEISTIQYSIGYEDNYEFGIHNHCLEHSGAYRAVLYDLYIKDYKD